jgi:hypothetical protein
MKKFHQSLSDENTAPPPNFVAILTSVAEMAKRLNKNISKVRRQPIRSALLAD